MYKRNAQGWSKHFDFMLVDVLSLQVAYILAVLIRHHKWAYEVQIYRKLGILFLLIDILVIVLHNSLHDVMQRGYYVEFIRTGEHCFYVFGMEE